MADKLLTILALSGVIDVRSIEDAFGQIKQASGPAGLELDLAEVMETTFSPEEIATFERCPPEARAEYFFTTWTLKEAIAKARGLGLAMPFSDVCLALEPQPHVVRDPGENAADWKLTSHAPLPTHRLAIALAPRAGKQAEVTIRTIDPAALA